MATHQTLDPVRKDELLTILADPKRRAVQRYLQEPPGDVATVGMLADELDEHDHGGAGVTEVSLVHSALPKLDRAGVVAFDERSMTVRYRATPEVEQLLRCIADI